MLPAEGKAGVNVQACLRAECFRELQGVSVWLGLGGLWEMAGGSRAGKQRPGLRFRSKEFKLCSAGGEG